MGLPYEALRFANSVRRELGLKPAKKLARATSSLSPLEATIQQGAPSVSVHMGGNTVYATRGNRDAQRTLPTGAAQFVQAYVSGLYPQYTA
jgi:hypothetical protein